MVKSILLSKDLAREAELDWSLKYLDGADMTGNQVAFQSWPRSGNTMLRRYLEIVSGIHTGSDGDVGIDMSL